VSIQTDRQTRDHTVCSAGGVQLNIVLTIWHDTNAAHYVSVANDKFSVRSRTVNLQIAGDLNPQADSSAIRKRILQQSAHLCSVAI